MCVMKVTEHTYGLGSYMRIRFQDNSEEEISVFWREGGEQYRTTADGDPAKRARIIEVFNALY